jgi:hypothetical protein
MDHDAVLVDHAGLDQRAGEPHPAVARPRPPVVAAVVRVRGGRTDLSIKPSMWTASGR